MKGLQEMALSPKLSPLMVLVLVHQVTKTCKGVAALGSISEAVTLSGAEALALVQITQTCKGIAVLVVYQKLSPLVALWH